MRYRPALLVTLGLCLAAGAAVRAQSQDPMKALSDQWESTFNAGNYEATAALYTSDAVRYPPGAEPQRGTDAILADMRNYEGFKIELTVKGSKMAGDMGSGWGTYALSGTDPDGNAVEQSGPWLSVLVKGKDGKWKIYQDIWNVSEPGGGM